jgi:hypothetical protein
MYAVAGTSRYSTTAVAAVVKSWKCRRQMAASSTTTAI